jgi:hypothetical protein
MRVVQFDELESGDMMLLRESDGNMVVGKVRS